MLVAATARLCPPAPALPAPPETAAPTPVEAHDRPSFARGGAPYHFVGGVADAHRGVRLLFENVNPTQDAAEVRDRVKQQLDEVPQELVKRVNNITVLARQDVAFDSAFEREYGIPGFQAVAAGGGGDITFFGGKPYSVGTFFHELGHNLPVSHSGWRKVVEQDDAAIAKLREREPLSAEPLETVPDPVRQARWHPRLQPGGVTPYGDGRISEDIAESLRFLLSERHFKRSFATAGEGASARPLWFAEAYPNRTRFLEAAAKADLDASDEQGIAAS